jgi:hypothetical protein
MNEFAKEMERQAEIQASKFRAYGLSLLTQNRNCRLSKRKTYRSAVMEMSLKTTMLS